MPNSILIPSPSKADLSNFTRLRVFAGLIPPSKADLSNFTRLRVFAGLIPPSKADLSNFTRLRVFAGVSADVIPDPIHLHTKMDLQEASSYHHPRLT
ncbi:hypothetical protein J6590_010298 [Homalodisca vitripennis]|nr:hypothetical protein J6590_010298 [Homalodisca vitripennis]